MGLLRSSNKFEVAHRLNGNLNGIIHTQEERARILEPPTHIGDAETRVGGQQVSLEMRLHDESKRMACSVHGEGSQNLDLEISRRQNLALHQLRRESDFRVSVALEDVFIHLVIAGVAATIPSGCVHHYQSAGLARGRVEIDRPLLQLECPMHSVEDVTQRETNLCLSGIEF